MLIWMTYLRLQYIFPPKYMSYICTIDRTLFDKRFVPSVAFIRHKSQIAISIRRKSFVVRVSFKKKFIWFYKQQLFHWAKWQVWWTFCNRNMHKFVVNSKQKKINTICSYQSQTTSLCAFVLLRSMKYCIDVQNASLWIAYVIRNKKKTKQNKKQKS